MERVAFDDELRFPYRARHRASRGIGYATARALAKAGAHIVAIAGTQGGLEELDDEIRKDGGQRHAGAAEPHRFRGHRTAGAALHERHGKLDILVGNAGIAGPSSPLGHIELKPWNDVIAGECHRQFPADPLHDPLLRVSDAGRAVFVTSGTASANAYQGPYAASKAALDTLARSWANETVSTKLRVNLFNPARPSRTRMRAAVFPGEDPMTLDTPEQAAEFIVPMCAPEWATEDGGQAATTTRPAR